MGFIRKLNPNIAVILIIAVVSLYLTLRWLPGEAIIAGGDIGIPNLLPQKQLGEVISSWWDSHGTGVSSSTGYTSIPYYVFLTLLDSVGFTHDITQKIVFFLVITGGAFSIYFLALNFSFKRWTAFLAALFYIFNLTSLSVWQRAVHNAIFMLLLAPLSLLILSWGIKYKKYSSIILMNLVSFALAYVFGAFGYVFSLWLLWTIYIFTIICFEWKDTSSRKFILVYFFLLIVSWIGTNYWWILPVLTSSNYALGQFTTVELKARGSDVLTALKPYHEPAIILRGLSRFYHYVVKDWGEIYSSKFFIILSWIPIFIVFFTTLIKSNYKLAPFRFLIILIGAVLFFSKGVNPPLGYLNRLPLDTFHFLTPLRNPYEKIGILLTIPFSLLFALGITQIILIFKSKKISFLNPIIIFIAISCLTILVWPLWFGRLFISEGRKYTVPIPNYYSEASNWLKAKTLEDDTRILHLPLAWGESVDYNWGYTGIEPSQYFFHDSSIGYHLGISSVDSRLRDILLLIHNQNTQDIQKAFASLNIGWVVVHNETLYKDRILEPPERINEWIGKSTDLLEYIADFGPLSIWRVKDAYRAGHFYATRKLVNLSGLKPLSQLEIWDNINALNDGFLTEIQKEHEDTLDKFLEKNIIFPQGKIKYSPLGSIETESALREIAIVNHLPDSPLYPLIVIKENILAFLNQNDSVRNCFSLTGKRLKEAALFARLNKPEETKQALSRYNQQLNECAQISKDTLSIYLNTGFLREEILGQFIRQKTVLVNEFNNALIAEEGVKTKRNLNQYLASLGLSPKFDPVKQKFDKQIIIFNFSIPKTDKYNIQINNADGWIDTPLKVIQIDDQVLDLSPIELSEGKIIFGSYEFTQGFHEIHLETSLAKNLMEDSLEAKKINLDSGFKYEVDPITKELVFVGNALSSSASLEFDFPSLEVTESYEVLFDIFFNQGSQPIFTITHDTDPEDKGNIKPAVKRELQLVKDLPNWRNISLNYTPTLNATSAKIAFTLAPSTSAKIKNIRVDKVFQYDLTLEKVSTGEPSKIGTVDINWHKNSPVLYELDLSNQKAPYVIVFSETFHPLWEITDDYNKKIELPHFSVNGFANGWLVEKDLSEKIKVQFVLQNILLKGVIITIISFFTSSIVLVYLEYRGKIK